MSSVCLSCDHVLTMIPDVVAHLMVAHVLLTVLSMIPDVVAHSVAVQTVWTPRIVVGNGSEWRRK